MLDQTPAAVLGAVRDCRERLQRLEVLLADLPTASPRRRTFSTWAVARILNLTPTALSIWAKRHGAGAARDGWICLGREEGSGYWRWLPVEEVETEATQ